MKVKSDSLCHVMRNREFISIAAHLAGGDGGSNLLKKLQSDEEGREAASVRMTQIVPCPSSGEPFPKTEIFIEGKYSASCYIRRWKNKAANGFVCIHQIRTATQVQLNRSRRRKPCGRGLSLTYDSEPCAFSQTCATRTSRQPAMILRSMIIAPNARLASRANRK